MWPSFFKQYLGSGGGNEDRGEREVDERPSFEQFLSSAQGLSKSHLAAQRDGLQRYRARDRGRHHRNLDENGICRHRSKRFRQNGKYSLEDVEEALAVVQEFDRWAWRSRNLRECLLTQLVPWIRRTRSRSKSFPSAAEAAVGASESGRREPGDPAGPVLQANN